MKQGFNVVCKKAFLSRLQRLARTNFLQSLWAVQLWGRNNNFQTFFPECSIEDVNSFSTQKRKITFCQKIGFILFFSRTAFLISCLDYFYEKSAPFPHHPPRALDSLKSSFQKWQSFIEMSLFSRGVVGRFRGCSFLKETIFAFHDAKKGPALPTTSVLFAWLDRSKPVVKLLPNFTLTEFSNCFFPNNSQHCNAAWAFYCKRRPKRPSFDIGISITKKHDATL